MYNTYCYKLINSQNVILDHREITLIVLIFVPEIMGKLLFGDAQIEVI